MQAWLLNQWTYPSLQRISSRQQHAMTQVDRVGRHHTAGILHISDPARRQQEQILKGLNGSGVAMLVSAGRSIVPGLAC